MWDVDLSPGYSCWTTWTSSSPTGVTSTHSPMEEVVRAMTFVIDQGMAMYWGTSRWNAVEIMEAYSVACETVQSGSSGVCEQAEYHYFQRDKVELHLPELYHKIGNTYTHTHTGVGAMTWSPLACGSADGEVQRGSPRELQSRHE
ncbi:hypothetical protein L3Q82_016387, partial [Scortum barcoo]